MANLKSIIRAALNASEPYAPAIVGKRDGVTVSAGDNKIWVTHYDGSEETVINHIAPNVPGLKIFVGRSIFSPRPRVLELRDAEDDVPFTALPGHHATHEWSDAKGTGGYDLTLVSLRQYLPFRPTPGAAGGIDIYTGRVMTASGLVNWQGGNVSLLPSDGPLYGAYYLTISIDATGAAVKTAGEWKAFSALTLADIAPPPAGNIVVCAVLRFAAQSELHVHSERDIVDLRSALAIQSVQPLYHSADFTGDGTLTSPLALGSFNPAAHFTPASAQHKYLVSGATPFTYAESVGGLNIAAGKTLTVAESLTIAAAGAAGYTLTVPGTGVALVKTTALTVGRIPFGVAGGLVGESANLYWDNTAIKLTVIGEARFGGTASDIPYYLTSTDPNVYMSFQDSITSFFYSVMVGAQGNNLALFAGGGQRATILASGSVVIGTTTDGMTAGGSLAIAKDLAHRGTKAGFFAAAPVTQQTGYAVPTDLASCIAALTALRTALNNYGLTTTV